MTTPGRIRNASNLSGRTPGSVRRQIGLVGVFVPFVGGVRRVIPGAWKRFWLLRLVQSCLRPPGTLRSGMATWLQHCWTHFAGAQRSVRRVSDKGGAADVLAVRRRRETAPLPGGHQARSGRRANMDVCSLRWSSSPKLGAPECNGARGHSCGDGGHRHSTAAAMRLVRGVRVCAC